jgi:hypothetical protein
MGKAKPLTVQIYVGNQKVEKLTDEHKKLLSEMLSRSMSLYYTAHPERWERFCKNN